MEILCAFEIFKYLKLHVWQKTEICSPRYTPSFERERFDIAYISTLLVLSLQNVFENQDYGLI